MNASTMSWRTPQGVRVPAVTAAQMREIDRIAMEETGPNLFQMMENAGRNLAGQAIDLLGPAWLDVNIVVLAGPGGNGGGGICAARHLANRNARVTLCLSEPGKLAPVAAFQLKIYQAAGGRLVDARALLQRPEMPPDLIVDALIGYSLAGAPRGSAAELIRWALAAGAPVLALDVPSGLDATTGRALGEVIQARRTLTLAMPKTGLTAPQTGDLWLADIGIPRAVYERLGLDYAAPFGDGYTVPLEAVP